MVENGNTFFLLFFMFLSLKGTGNFPGTKIYDLIRAQCVFLQHKNLANFTKMG